MEFARLRDGVLVCDQRAYTEDLLQRWGLKDANPAALAGEPESSKRERGQERESTSRHKTNQR
eukprot:11045171-Prorocentrum_lima.AAC.1